MSGTANQIPPIPIRFDGAENVQRTIDAIVARIGTLETAATKSSQSFGTLRTQAETTGNAFRNTGQIIGQAGYQVQDFAVQVASGQSALTAFIQQGSQLASIFGPTGVLVGAGLAVGAVALQFLRLGESAEDAQRRIDTANRAATQGADLYRAAMDQLTAAVQRNAAAERDRAAARQVADAVGAAQASIDFDRRTLAGVQDRLGRLIQEGAADQLAEYRRIHGADAVPDVLNSGARRVRELIALQSQERSLIESIQATQRARLVAITPDPRGDESGADRGDYWAARNEFLRRQASDDAADLDPISQLIRGQYRDYTGALSPSGGGGSSSRRDPRQYGPLDGSPQGLMQLERGSIRYQEEMARALERQAREEERFNERREDANRRVTDSIVNYTSESFATLFDENGKGWEGMLETFESTFKRTIARIAAEAIIRPVVEPIVSSLGLGSLGRGNGGFSGLFGGSVSSGGGSGGIGAYQQAWNNAAEGLPTRSGGLFSSGGLLGGIGGILNSSIWSSGGGWFGAPSVASGINGAAMSTDDLMAALPASPTSATTGAGYGPGGSMSVGGAIASVGAGYAAGSALGSFIAGQNKARQTNSQIGAGAGAVAGLALTPFIGPLGPVVGGAAGGAIGGLIGPGKGFSGGDVGVAVDANGYLTLGTSGGKNWNGTDARNQTSAGLNSINDLLRGAGVNLNGLQGAQLGYQGYGGSGNVFGPTEIWQAVRGNLTTSNSTLAAALSQPWMQSFEDLSVIAPYAASNDNLTRALNSGGIRSRDDFNNAAQWITGTYEPLLQAASLTNKFTDAIAAQNKVYDDAIAKARELGLAEGDLWEAREKGRLEAIEARNFAVGNATAALRVDELRATGRPGALNRASLLEFDIAGRQRTDQLSTFLEDNGFLEGSPFYDRTMGRLAALLKTQRSTLQDTLRESLVPAETATGDSGIATNSGTALLQNLLVGEAGGLSAQARFAGGVATLENLRRSGNLDAYTSFASQFLGTARDYLGTSERFGDLTAQIKRDTVALGGDPTGLLRSIDVQTRTADAAERFVAGQNVTNDELRALRREMARLSAQVVTLQQRRAA